MATTGRQVISKGSGTGGYTVDFVDDAGAVISIRFATSLKASTPRMLLRQAKMYLHRILADDMLPDKLENGENQDSRAATIASSANSPSERTSAAD
jgi:hypothetical protein